MTSTDQPTGPVGPGGPTEPGSSPRRHPSLRLRTVAAIGAGVVALGGLGAVGVAVADGTDPSTRPSASPSAGSPDEQGTTARPGPGGPDGQRGSGPGGSRDAGLAMALATELDRDADEVAEALRSARAETRPAPAERSGRDEDGSTSASPDTPSPSAPSDSAPSDEETQTRQEALVSSLAESLEVSEDEVRAALETVSAQRQEEAAEQLQRRLDEAVTDGTLTQAEADAVTKAAQEGVIGGGPGRGR